MSDKFTTVTAENGESFAFRGDRDPQEAMAEFAASCRRQAQRYAEAAEQLEQGRASVFRHRGIYAWTGTKRIWPLSDSAAPATRKKP